MSNKPLEPDEIIPGIERRYRPKPLPRPAVCPKCHGRGPIDLSSVACISCLIAAFILALTGSDGWGWFLFFAVLVG